MLNCRHNALNRISYPLTTPRQSNAGSGNLYDCPSFLIPNASAHYRSLVAAYRGRPLTLRIPNKDLLIVPAKKISCGTQTNCIRQHDLFPMNGIILVPIFELFLDPAADFYTIFWRYGDIATVKECMHVLTKQDSVRDCVGPTVGVRFNVCSIENMQHRRACERTAPLVGIRDQHAKGPLTKPGQNKLWLTKARPHLCDFRRKG